MPKYLVKTLLIPLAIGALVSFALGYFFPWQGFFVNLATTFVGTLITILFVDRVLNEHNRTVWEKVDARIQQRYVKFANGYIHQLCLALDKTKHYFGGQLLGHQNLQQVQLRVASIVEEQLIPDFPKLLKNLDGTGWSKIAKSLESLMAEGDRLVELYGHKLEPDDLQTILDLQDHMSYVLAGYDLFHFLLTTTETDAPGWNRQEAIESRDAFLALDTDRLTQGLRIATKILRTTVNKVKV